MKRYGLRLVANDGCFIPLLGYRRWRFYWPALYVAWKMSRGMDEHGERVAVWDYEAGELVS